MMFRPSNQQVLHQSNDAHIAMLAAQGNEQLTQAALAEMMTAQQAMQQVAQSQNLEVPKVNFYPSNHPDPKKARRKDIKQAYRLLQPAKRSRLSPLRWAGNKYRYNKDTGTCVVDGCDCAELIRHDNLYMRICDEDSGRSLWEMYWSNPVTGQPEAFIAQDKVTSGRKMRGTYCPEHLHLFHLLKKWETEEDKHNEMNPNRLKDKVKRGVSIVTVPVSSVKKKDPQPAMLQKYEPFFAELERDQGKTKGISVLHYKNPVTGVNDVTMIVFDLRIFQHELDIMNQPTADFQALLQQEQMKVGQQQNLDVEGQLDRCDSMFNFGQPQQPAGLNLSATGAPMAGNQSFGLGAQPQQPNAFMNGVAGGMGMQQQYGQMQQFGQQPITPPSEMELMNALLQSQNPIHRFIATGGLNSLIEVISVATSLTLVNVLKNATFAIDEDEGGMKLDTNALPDNLKTLSAENVTMLLNQIVNNSQQTLQQADMQRQQILAMSQQSMMGGALAAAMADEGTMQKVGSGIGTVARSFMGLPRQ